MQFNTNIVYIAIKVLNVSCTAAKLTVIIWLKARLQSNIGNTLQPVLMVFTHSGITLPKVTDLDEI